MDQFIFVVSDHWSPRHWLPSPNSLRSWLYVARDQKLQLIAKLPLLVLLGPVSVLILSWKDSMAVERGLMSWIIHVSMACPPLPCNLFYLYYDFFSFLAAPLSHRCTIYYDRGRNMLWVLKQVLLAKLSFSQACTGIVCNVDAFVVLILRADFTFYCTFVFHMLYFIPFLS